MKFLKETLLFFWEILKIVVIAAVIVIPIRYFLFQPFFVQGASMEPNFQDGDYLIIDELSYRFRPPKRGEVVVFRPPRESSQRYIKRIIGLPGETVEIKNGKITIYSLLLPNGQVLDESKCLSRATYTSGETQVHLESDEYFVLGDNRDHSSDSRIWGALSKKDIIGRVVLRAWPISALAAIEAPTY